MGKNGLTSQSKVNESMPFLNKGGKLTLSEVKMLQSFRFMIYLYAQGKTTDQVCQLMGISYSTLMRLRTRFPTLWHSVSKTKDFVDAQIEQALFRRSVGYSYKTKRTEYVIDEATGKIAEDKYGRQMVKVSEQEHHEPPNVDAIKFWLRNRKPDQWKEILELDFDAINDGQIFEQFEKVSKQLQEFKSKEKEDELIEAIDACEQLSDGSFDEEKFKKEVIEPSKFKNPVEVVNGTKNGKDKSNKK
jgi:hypothetical protein